MPVTYVTRFNGSSWAQGCKNRSLERASFPVNGHEAWLVYLKKYLLYHLIPQKHCELAEFQFFGDLFCLQNFLLSEFIAKDGYYKNNNA